MALSEEEKKARHRAANKKWKKANYEKYLEYQRKYYIIVLKPKRQALKQS